MTDYVQSWTDALERRRQARIKSAEENRRQRALMNLALSEADWQRQRQAYWARQELDRGAHMRAARMVTLDDAFDRPVTQRGNDQ